MITEVFIGPPTIIVQPVSQLISVGMNVALNCEGTGRGSIMYQWETYRKQWRAIRSNANGKIFTARNLQESQQYRCVISNEAGETISNNATVIVLSKSFYVVWTSMLYCNRDH